MPRSSSGDEARACPGPATGRVRSSGARRRTRRRRRGRVLGDQPASATEIDAVEQHRHPASAAADQKADTGGDVRRSQGGEALDRIGAVRGTPVTRQRLDRDHCLVQRALVVDAGAAAGDLLGRRRRGRPRSARRRASCCRCPCRPRSTGRRRQRSPRGDLLARPARGAVSLGGQRVLAGGSARTTCGLDRRVTSAGRSAEIVVDAEVQHPQGTPCCRASTLTPARRRGTREPSRPSPRADRPRHPEL